MANIYISNSNFLDSLSLKYAGSFYFGNAGNITIINCVFKKNKAKFGGAIFYDERSIYKIN